MVILVNIKAIQEKNTSILKTAVFPPFPAVFFLSKSPSFRTCFGISVSGVLYYILICLYKLLKFGKITHYGNSFN